MIIKVITIQFSMCCNYFDKVDCKYNYKNAYLVSISFIQKVTATEALQLFCKSTKKDNCYA